MFSLNIENVELKKNPTSDIELLSFLCPPIPDEAEIKEILHKKPHSSTNGSQEHRLPPSFDLSHNLTFASTLPIKNISFSFFFLLFVHACLLLKVCGFFVARAGSSYGKYTQQVSFPKYVGYTSKMRT